MRLLNYELVVDEFASFTNFKTTKKKELDEL